MPVGKDVKKRLDEWLDENVNVPLSKRGYPDTGAALSAAVSAGGELLIPDDLADVAMAMLPGGMLLKSGKKGMKALKLGDKAGDTAQALKKAKPGLAKAGTIDYGEIKKAEDTARKAAIKKADEAADTLVYDPSGTVTRKKAKKDTWSDGLEMLEKISKDKNK